MPLETVDESTVLPAGGIAGRREPELELEAGAGSFGHEVRHGPTLAVLFLCALIGGGLLLMAAGKGLWLFVLALAIFLGLFIRYGCLAH